MDILRLSSGRKVGYISLYTVFVCLCLSSTVHCKQCIQNGLCTCTFDDGTGLIDLTPLGRKDNTPLIDQISSSTTTDGYKYSYNPCFPFNQGTCQNVSGCQFDPSNIVYYDIGDASTAKLSYDDKDKNIIAEYTTNGDIGRKTVVAFKCDPTANPPQFRMNGESPVAVYSFEITSKFACPLSMNSTTTIGPSTTGRKECYKIDKCRCEFNDGSGVIDLSKVGRMDGVPLIDREYKAGNFTYSFNPCYPFREGLCVHAAGCQHDVANKTLYYNIGDARRVDFHYDGFAVVGTYTSTDGARKSIVRYVCNSNMVVPAYQVDGEISFSTYGFTILGKDLCPRQPINLSSSLVSAAVNAINMTLTATASSTEKTSLAAYTTSTGYRPSSVDTQLTFFESLKRNSTAESILHASSGDISSAMNMPSLLTRHSRVKIPLNSTQSSALLKRITDKTSKQRPIYKVQVQAVESTFTTTLVATSVVSAGILFITLAAVCIWKRRYRSRHDKQIDYNPEIM